MSGLKELLESWLVRLSTDPKLVLSCLNVSTCHDTNVHIPSFEAVLFNAVRHLEHVRRVKMHPLRDDAFLDSEGSPSPAALSRLDLRTDCAGTEEPH